MVGSRHDTKRRRKNESPQDTQPKRTKVHAQRKFAQGAGGGLTLTPMKDKEKPRSNTLGAFNSNGANSNGSVNGPTSGAGHSSTGNGSGSSGTTAALANDNSSTPSFKRPSTEDFLTFLCFHRTNMLPGRLQFLSNAPQQENHEEDVGSTAQDSSRGSRSTERNLKEHSANGSGNRRTPLKTHPPLPSHKAVTAAQALKKKYQDQRLKKTVASTLIQKGTQRLRTTRSGAHIVPAVKGPFVANKSTPRKESVSTPANKKKVPVSSKSESAPKKSVKTPTNSKALPSTPNSSSSTRGGLRSGGPQKLLSLRTQKSSVPQRKSPLAKPTAKIAGKAGKTPLKPVMASSMSDFSSEDDQPLVKKNKPLMQARKLLKKSIASIGRKLMLEPRRSRRGISLPTGSPATRSERDLRKTALTGPSKRFRAALRGISQKTKDTQGHDDSVTESSSETPKKKEGKAQNEGTTPKGKSKIDAKESKDLFPESKRKTNKKEAASAKKPNLPKMKKGYVLELVAVSDGAEDVPKLSKLRRASRDFKAQKPASKAKKPVASPEPMSRRSSGVVSEEKTKMKVEVKKVGKKEEKKTEKKGKTAKGKGKQEEDSDEEKPLAKITRRSQAQSSDDEKKKAPKKAAKSADQDEEKSKGRWSKKKEESSGEEDDDDEEEDEDGESEEEKKVTRRSSGRLSAGQDRRRTRRSVRNDYSSDEDENSSSDDDESDDRRKSLRRSTVRGRPRISKEESEDEARKTRGRKSAKISDDSTDEKPKRGRRSAKVSSDDTADEGEAKSKTRRKSVKAGSSDDDKTAKRSSIRKGKKVVSDDESKSKTEDIKKNKDDDSSESRPASPVGKKKETKTDDKKKDKKEVKNEKGKKKKKSTDDEEVVEPVKSKLRKVTPKNLRVSDSGDSDESVPATPQRVLRERKSYLNFEEDEFSDLEDELLEEPRSPPPLKNEIEAKDDKLEEKPAPVKEAEKKTKEPAAKEKKAAAKETDKIKKVVKDKAKTALKQVKKTGKKVKKPADAKSNEELATAFEKITLSKEEDSEKAVLNIPNVASFLKVPKPDVVEPIQVSTESEIVTDDLPSPLSTLAMAATSSLLNEKEKEEKDAKEIGKIVSTSAPLTIPSPQIAVQTKTIPPPLTPYIPVSVPITTEETKLITTSRTMTSTQSGPLPMFSPMTIRMSTPTPSPMTSGAPMMSSVSLSGQVPVMLTIPTPPCVSTSVSTPMSAVSASMLVSTSATGSSSLIIPTSSTVGGLQGPATISMSTSNQVTGLAPLLTSGMMQTQGATLASMQAATSITSSQLVFIKPPDKKDGQPTVHGGMPDPTITMSPVVLGMNPLLINNRNAGPTFFISPTGQMVPGLSIPPVLSLRLPDKTGGPQQLFAGTQLYTVPIAIGNPVVSTGMVSTTNQTVMKGARTAQFVLASKPGTVPNAPGNPSGGTPLILSVGEDGSHLLSEAPAGTIMTQGTSTAIWKENQFVATDSSGLLSVIPTIKSAVPQTGIIQGSSSVITQGVTTLGPVPSMNVLPPSIRPSTPLTQNMTTVVSSTICTPVSTPVVAPTLLQVKTTPAAVESSKPSSTSVVSTQSLPTSTLTTTSSPVCVTSSSTSTPVVSTSVTVVKTKKTKAEVPKSCSPVPRSDTPTKTPKSKTVPKSSTPNSPAKTAITVSAAAALAAVSTVSKSYNSPSVSSKPTNSLPSIKDNIVKCPTPVVTATVSSDTKSTSKPSKEESPAEPPAPRAATHNTLLMLSSAIKKNDPTKEQKLVVKKTTTESSLSMKKPEPKLDITDKSGLASLAEVASTLAERVCTPPSTPDKSALTPDKCSKGSRMPEHSFWTNPAHILGRETLKMPGLPLTSNLGVATKSELAKMKIGATLSDAVETAKPPKPKPEPEKKPKVEPVKVEEPKPPLSPIPSSPSCNAASRVRKWLNENPPEEAEMKIEEPAAEDVSNLKSLADLCVSMERIAEPPPPDDKPKLPEVVVEKTPVREQKEEQPEKESTPPKSTAPSTCTTTAPSVSMSPQTKIAWQTAFGVKSGANKNVKTTPKKKAPGSPSAPALNTKGPATICERWGNLKNIRIRQGGESEAEPPPTMVNKTTETGPPGSAEATAPVSQPSQREESQSSSSNEETVTVEKKSASTNQRRSFLHRMNERKDPTPSANAFSVSNESSVYAFEADPELPPVSKPFRRRSKTSSRSEEDLTRLSGEEDSSCTSTSTSIAVQVNMDSVPASARIPTPPSEPALKIVPIKEADSRGTEISTQTEGSTNMDEEYSDSDSHTIYIPLASGPTSGTSSTEGPQFQGLAVKVDTDGGPTHQRLIMKFQTQFVTKPVFKRPSTGSGSGSDEASAPKRPVLATQHPRPSAPLEPLTTTPPIGTVPPYTTRPRSGSTGLIESPLKKSLVGKEDASCDPKEEEKDSKTLRLETIAAGEEKVFAHPDQVKSSESSRTETQTEKNKTAEKEKVSSESCSDTETEKAKVPSAQQSTSAAAESRASTSRESSPPPKSKAPAKAPAAKRRASQEPPVKQPKQRRAPKSKAFSSSSSSPPPSPTPSTSSTSTAGRPSSVAGRRSSFAMSGTVLEAPIFYPTEKEFQDPLEYFERIRPAAEKFGICRIVPPSTFKPDCCVSDDMRFTAYNQYIHKTLHRWGPNTKELRAIKKYLATQSIQLKQVPLVGGMEVDLPRLYATVQNMGGLGEVIEKKRWFKVADAMRIPKSAQDRVAKLDDIYCKYLLPYDTLSSAERENLFDMVELEWSTREANLNKQSSSSSVSSDDEDSDSESGDEMEECIVKGRSTSLSAFYRIARNTMSMWFKSTEPPAGEVEAEFWKHVRDRNNHVCVHSGSIDSGNNYGFPVKNSSFAKHPWNLKVLTNNTGSVLRSLGPVMGVTVPTIHVGMLFTTCCWYRDPHSLPWVEYLHTGASKIWYGIPDSESALFREAVKDVAPQYVRDQTLWLASDTAMVPPPLLTEKEVTLSRTVQAPGQFVLVFPRSYVSSICTGYLVSESVYFAPPSWLDVAQQAFKELQDSSEPSMFSLEKLMFSIAEDSRSSVDVLNQVLPVIMTIIENELSRRGSLRKAGMDNTERLPLDGRSKKKSQKVDLDDFECEVCRASLYVSMVSQSQEETVWCLPHALEQIGDQRDLAKQCKLLYTYSQKELNELLQNLLDRIEDKTVSKPPAKPSGSKSRGNSSR